MLVVVEVVVLTIVVVIIMMKIMIVIVIVVVVVVAGHTATRDFYTNHILLRVSGLESSSEERKFFNTFHVFL